MTREEAIQVCTDVQTMCLSDRIKDAMRMAIEALKEESHRVIKPEKEDVGFGADEIFLLSTKEYEKYKDEIPVINCWWWLRSPSPYPNLAQVVRNDGSVDDVGHDVSYNDSAVRPALKLKGEYDVGARIVLNGFTWIVIDKSLAIAEVPIWFTVFDADGNSCYRDSYIRAYLKKWLEGRSEISNAKEQKKAKWSEKGVYDFACTNCDCHVKEPLNYCPNCGAEMEEI